MSRNAKIGWGIVAGFIALVAFGNMVTHDDKSATKPASSSTPHATGWPTTAPTMTADELKDAEYSAMLIQHGVNFTPADRDALILRAHTVCVFLQVNDNAALADAGRGLVDTYGYSTHDAAAIAYSAAQVYCPEQS